MKLIICKQEKIIIYILNNMIYMVRKLFEPKVNNNGKEKIQKLIDHLSKKEFQSALINKFANINGTIRYATDIESNTIIWANEQAQLIYGENIIGKKCYEIFKEQCGNCEVCTVDKIIEKEGMIYSWFHNNKETGQYYLIRDVMFIIDDKNIRFEEAINITPYIEFIKGKI